MNKSTIPVEQRAALSLLLDDHRHAKRLFKQFESVRGMQEKKQIAMEVCQALEVHTQIEEELFYPKIRADGGEKFADLLDEAKVEHASAKDLIAQIQRAGTADELFEAKVKVLSEYIAHHVSEEEEELFPKVIAKKIDLKELAEEMAARREELMETALA
ncbi:hypothetical protein PIGHUM_02993 [Pigmentiphaga humi]|uniref:Hemerythrin-like domain-containing protein n=1 Tax=Pigmentiphaga humi TaxID=2478468 RepID=A0A3P4B3N3_9BURK|nr:hemerythrin domain-containing protein [Pigmentiphaga humi]VCU70913.1 hypothetical protein PIGHUM_02993 [Pigmentiphaga humi]